MISSTRPPRNKSQLVQSINRLPNSLKFDVIEVSSPSDKLSVNKMIDQYAKNGPYSVIILKSQ